MIRTLTTLLIAAQCIAYSCTGRVHGDDVEFVDPSPTGTWARHTIDNTSQGADGVRLADANQDGRPDIVTGWEQGGVTRVYLHPGTNAVKQPWPMVTVGVSENVEDAVLVDLDGDGSLDVVSSCEGQRQALIVHWAPKLAQYRDPTHWTTVDVPQSKHRFQWMFATPMDVDEDGQVDLIAGGKGKRSELGWWKIPDDARNVAGWKWNRLRPMGWLMSLEQVDMDGDGDQDILFTDRKGERRGCYWLENSKHAVWREHLVGANEREAMFVHRTDIDGDGLEDVIVATRPHTILIYRRVNATGLTWEEHEINIPDSFGGTKAVAAGDLNGNGHQEIIFSTEGARNGKMAIGLLTRDPVGGDWELASVSGVDGIKHDLVELIDLDSDGDLDILTCEESRNLGVIWYENPHR